MTREVKMELLRSIFPIRWIPPFRRGDWTQEEAIQTRIIVAGKYDPKKIPNIDFNFTDETFKINYRVKFQGGMILLERLN